MKKLLILLMLLSCGLAFSAEKVSHKHGDRNHSHILPPQGINHTHNGNNQAKKPHPKKKEKPSLSKVQKGITSMIIECSIYAEKVRENMVDVPSFKFSEEIKSFAKEHSRDMFKLCLKTAAFKLNEAADAIE